jgi:predicted TIM-barrel fold metal-dependent hydrolase
MDEQGIVLGVASGPPAQVVRWRLAAPANVLGAVKVDEMFPFPDIVELREMILAGQVGMIGEIQAQHLGIPPDDPLLGPYLALAAELDVPVAIHSGLGAPNTPFECCPEFRASLGNPLLLESVLIRHPGLRVNLMHAGYPYLDQTIALMVVYPNVYADIGAISWGVIPRAEFHRYLHALVTAGLGDRLMFGSDQMYWPEAIEWAIEGVSSASFLSEEQRRDIFYNNAARFLRLSEEEIARHHRK